MQDNSKIFKNKNVSAYHILITIVFCASVFYFAIQVHNNYFVSAKVNTEEITPARYRPTAASLSLVVESSNFVLPELPWIPQTLHNCAPATVAMLLGNFGISTTQDAVRKILRPRSDDKNVFTYEISDYLKNNYNIYSHIFYNGDIDVLKSLTRNGYYVIVEELFKVNDNRAHDIIIRGYDDTKGVVITEDSFLGPDVEVPYATFDLKWKGLNREYMPVFLPKDEARIQKIVGANFDANTMYQNSVNFNLSVVGKNSSDMYSWFNLGTSYYALGKYDLAIKAFEKSKALGWPKEILWYQLQPMEAYIAVGDFTKALELARFWLASDDSFPELHFEAAKALYGLGRLSESKAEAEKTLELSPNFNKAKEVLNNINI